MVTRAQLDQLTKAANRLNASAKKLKEGGTRERVWRDSDHDDDYSRERYFMQHSGEELSEDEKLIYGLI